MKNKEPSQQLIIEGAGCASCVGKIESAIQSTAGVVSAEMNFADRTVMVSGTAHANELIKAVESAGYNAKLLDNAKADQMLDEKEAADWKYYKKLLRDTFIALNYLLGNIQVTAPVGNSSSHQSNNNPLPDKIIRSKEVQELTGLSRTTIWRLEREGKFPARVPLTASNVGWRLTDVQEWIRKK
jgi:predicted DNA-binding transcriptional regulator AlpA/copper chaperone CopZ